MHSVLRLLLDFDIGHSGQFLQHLSTRLRFPLLSSSISAGWRGLKMDYFQKVENIIISRK
ncbi:hypothetical protein T11_11593 [Trichinella zimbabwensis]|uniref:Uncharacterized protein n=1 Tax=Trichinella zimbabwensis TaxID=268475 RepID=A0A0V1I9J0_9BILA|nr:hypothetical protein T11_11593 [Trichinella zimbabwensis]